MINGILLAVPEGIEDLMTIKRLWIHEAMRVYYDRLVYPEEKGTFFQTMRSVCADNLKVRVCIVMVMTSHTVRKIRPIMWLFFHHMTSYCY